MKATLTIGADTFTVTPEGLGSLKPVTAVESEQIFYRKKVTGSIAFIGDDFLKVSALKGCCTIAILNVYNDCSASVPENSYQILSSKVEWEFSTCTATVSELTILDDYRGVYRYYEKKVNLLKLPANLTITHMYDHPYPNPTDANETLHSVVSGPNQRFRTFNSAVFYIIQQTFTGTEYDYLIPTLTTFSQFLTLPTNPANNSANLFLRLGIGQASDVLDPTSSQAATGVLQTGLENESMTISLKDLLADLFAMADCYWFIDETTGKFRIEHRLYFDNGYSYTSPVFGIDLRLSRYKENLSSYYGNYKLNTESLFGVEELSLDLNLALNKSSLAFPIGNDTKKLIKLGQQAFEVVDDFELGNIKYQNECSPKDEKGVLVKNTRNVSLFMTMLDSIPYDDSAIDKTKWFLVEYVDSKSAGSAAIVIATRTANAVTGNTLVLGLAERRNVIAINGNLSATALMRSFHRHGRSFSSGLMNYSDTVPSEVGVNRNMYSIKPTKFPQIITITHCCNDEFFSPYKFITLPDGNPAKVVSATENKTMETIDLELVTGSECGLGVVPVPATNSDTSGGNTGTGGTGGTGTTYPAYGTFLRKEPVQVTCTLRGQQVTKEGIRTFYADGVGGEYFTDSNPCISGRGPT